MTETENARARYQQALDAFSNIEATVAWCAVQETLTTELREEYTMKRQAVEHEYRTLFATERGAAQ